MTYSFKLQSQTALTSVFLALGLVLSGCAQMDAAPEAFEIAAETSSEIAAPRSAETPIMFEPQNGEPVAAFAGTFTVPENRANPQSRRLTIHYVRFPATTGAAGAPIVYLSGGPGGSGIGTAKGPRFPLFMAMRQHGDVIAYDQRGTGQSDDMEMCSRAGAALTEFISDADYKAGALAALDSCLTEWTQAGIDIGGYDTDQNARDLDALRRHLGAEKISLWGISYGSHLGLAALKVMDDKIERAVFASIEGLSQTVKLPERTDAYFGRLQSAMTARDPNAPDVKALIRRVHARFDDEPQLLNINGTEALFHRRDLQSFLSGAISDPKWAMLTVSIYRDMDQGDMSSFEALYGRFGVTADYQFRPMSTLTDLASGTPKDRRELITAQLPRSVIGAHINAPFEYEDVRPSLVLGDDFREPVNSAVPVLMLSGTLDGRTYPEAARETMGELPNVHHILIEDAGHNLFMTDPKVGDIMHRFMRGERDLPGMITVPIPQ